jgi:regulator of sigma E protease
MAAANPWKRIAVLLAGPTMNLLSAVILFIVISGIIGSLPDRRQVEVYSIVPALPASTAGMQPGDILVSIGGVPIHSLDAAHSEIYANLGNRLNFVYERDGVAQVVSITPLINPGPSGAVGIGMTNPRKAFTIWGAIPEGFNFVYDYLKQLFAMIGQIISGHTTSPDERLVGLKGMFDLYSWVRESTSTPGVPTIANVLFFFSSISISLGIMNLLPIPALDGGRILFALPEIIIRKRIPPKYEVWVNFISFALLILLMIFINLQDFIHPITTPIP